ncbi:AAA family ATPase [Dictyobacter halimunensis]
MPIGDLRPESSTHDTPYRLDLIVGVNGTGKSTLLHLLADLFQHLSRSNDSPPFKFSIIYRLNKDPQHPITVTITNQTGSLTQRFYLHVEDDQQVFLFDGPSDKIDEKYLPDAIVAFTSGSEGGWLLPSAQTSVEEDDPTESPPNINAPDFGRQLREWYQLEHSQRSEPMLVQSIVEQNKNIEDAFLFIQYNQLPLIILCGLLIDLYIPETIDISPQTSGDTRNHPSSLLNDALKEIKITALRSFSLKIHLISENIAPDDKSLIQRMITMATYAVKQGNDVLLVFHLYDEHSRRLRQEIIQQLVSLQGNALRFFRWLNQLTIPHDGKEAILSEVNLFLERDYRTDEEREEKTLLPPERAPLHMLEWFSDGEVSFLGRLCALSLLRENEALILLDEPEVHFNDYWKRQLVSMLNKFLQDQYSHVIMTTHSSITLSDVYNTNIWVMKRNGIFTEYAAPPNLRTLGTDPSDIIVHIFGAESATGAQSISYIQGEIRRIRLLTTTTQEKIEQLQRLQQNVGPGPLRFLIRREIYALEDEQNSQPSRNEARLEP